MLQLSPKDVYLEVVDGRNYCSVNVIHYIAGTTPSRAYTTYRQKRPLLAASYVNNIKEKLLLVHLTQVWHFEVWQLCIPLEASGGTNPVARKALCMLSSFLVISLASLRSSRKPTLAVLVEHMLQQCQSKVYFSRFSLTAYTQPSEAGSTVPCGLMLFAFHNNHGWVGFGELQKSE